MIPDSDHTALLRSISSTLQDLRTLMLHVLGPDAGEFLLTEKRITLAERELDRDLSQFNDDGEAV